VEHIDIIIGQFYVRMAILVVTIALCYYVTMVIVDVTISLSYYGYSGCYYFPGYNLTSDLPADIASSRQL